MRLRHTVEELKKKKNKSGHWGLWSTASRELKWWLFLFFSWVKCYVQCDKISVLYIPYKGNHWETYIFFADVSQLYFFFFFLFLRYCYSTKFVLQDCCRVKTEVACGESLCLVIPLHHMLSIMVIWLNPVHSTGKAIKIIHHWNDYLFYIASSWIEN